MRGEIVINMEKYHAVLKEWTQQHPCESKIHPVSSMLKDFGLEYVKLTRDYTGMRARVVDERRLMMARMRYSV